MTTENPLTVETLLKTARANPGIVIVPRADNEEAMEALGLAIKDGSISGGTLIGNRQTIVGVANHVGLNTDQFQIVEIEGDEAIAATATRLIAEGKGDFLLKGQIDTKTYMKAILNKDVGLVAEGSTLSHLAILHLPQYHKLLIATDCAVIIEPSLEDKARIVQNAINFCRKLGISRPKIAILAAIEKVNPKMISTVHAAELVRQHRENGRFPNAYVEGPYDLYIATSAEGARIKNIQGEVCGDADVLVFPEINGANIFYKAMQRFVPDCWAAGIIGGARVPVLLPSRADDAETKRMSLLIAAYVRALEKCGR